MANRDVGPGKTYSTLQAAHDAGSAGDVIRVWPDAMPYSYVVITKAISMIGQEKGVRIQGPAGGSAILVDGDLSSGSDFEISNFVILPYSYSANITVNGVLLSMTGSGPKCTISRLYVQGCSFGVQAETTNGEEVVQSCMFQNCGHGVYADLGITVDNCTSAYCLFGFRSDNSLMIVNNCYAYGSGFEDIRATLGSDNASADGTGPTGTTTLSLSSAKLIGSIGGMFSEDARPRPDSPLLDAGGDISGLLYDFNGTAYSSGHYPIGCSLVPPFLESIPAADKIVIGNSAIDNYGNVTTGTAPSSTQLDAPSAFSLVSSADGLTHTISVTCAESNALFDIHDASHNTVAASVASGQKIRGLTPGTSYHCHAVRGA